MRSGRASITCSTLLALSVVLAPASFGQVTGSPVADAAMHGDIPAVRALLQKKADANTAQPESEGIVVHPRSDPGGFPAHKHERPIRRSDR